MVSVGHIYKVEPTDTVLGLLRRFGADQKQVRPGTRCGSCIQAARVSEPPRSGLARQGQHKAA